MTQKPQDKETYLKNTTMKPRLDDPKEWAIIREMYFAKDVFTDSDSDPLERLERMQSKERFNQKSSR